MIVSHLVDRHFLEIDMDDESARLEEIVDEKLNQTQRVVADFPASDVSSKSFSTVHQPYASLLEDEGITLAVYGEEGLLYWSNASTPLPLLEEELKSETPLIQLENGWYLLAKEHRKDVTVYGLSLVKHEYLYRNKYLKSSFQEDYGFYHDATLTTDHEKTGIHVDYKGIPLFTILVTQDSKRTITSQELWLAALFTLGLILVIHFLYQTAIRLSRDKNVWLGLSIFIIPLVAIRAWTFMENSPPVLYNLELFSADLYAQSTWLPSLGDLLFHIALAFLVCYFVYRVIKAQKELAVRNKALSYGMVLLGLLGLFFVAHQINDLLTGLVIHSQINFEISKLFDLSIYSFYGLLAIGMVLFTYFLLTNILVQLVRQMQFVISHYYFLLTLVAALHIVLSLVQTDFDLLQIVWPLLILLVTSLIGFSETRLYSFAPIVGLLIINALIAAHVVLKYSSEKELNDRMIYAEHKLADDEDQWTEIRFAQMEDSLLHSDVLRMPFVDGDAFDKARFDHAMETHFFGGHWDQYDIAFSLFDRDSLPLGRTVSTAKDYEELSDIINRSGMPSPQSQNIYYIPNYDSKLSYVIHLKIPGDNADLRGHLFCELKSKKLPKDIGFPELLIDSKTNTIDALAGYSFARYLDGALIFNLGPYNYSISDQKISESMQGKSDIVFQENGYSHLAYRVNDHSIIVLGKPLTTILEKATSFSYLFALFSLLILTAAALRNLDRIWDVRRLSLKNKIQFLVIGLILACLLLFGLGTRYFIAKQYGEKNNKLISEKIKSVNVEVKKKLKGPEFAERINPEDFNFVNSIMHKFSLVFFTDINLYDTEGTLVASSRHEVFNSGLLSKKLDPQAYVEMVENQRSEFIQEEQVGSMTYLSAYVPYVNESGITLGYLNLPYFAKQNPLENEISNFMVAIINIFVVLFALSIVAALFVSNWVTKPLKLLQISVSNIEFGKSNEPIQYTGQDEIGDLVQEYNKKVEELENAASQLAKSERESAWRDMAKQVAHEIKNPLTPMKLSVQHFQRSFDKDDPKAPERIERFSQTLIEQIETLTSIANEFSNFAKMPTPQIEEVNLGKTLLHAVELFNESDESSVSFKNLSPEQAVIRYDQEHLVRVFNNLIKNALQAIPYDRDGVIEVTLSEGDEHFLVEIKDNGSGIPEDKRDKIFVPNFTTKSKGMGLGLSMVKNIVNSAGGRVWFETEENVGTSFFVKLPKAAD